MPPAAAPTIPHTPARALFAQACTHDTHYLNHKGDLYTVLITGGNRVLILKNGSVLAQSGPLFEDPPATTAAAVTSTSPLHANAAGVNATSKPATHFADCFPSSSSSSNAGGPCVYDVSICRFTDDVLRLAVATTADIFLFEYDDAGLLWQDTRPSSFWHTADQLSDEDNYSYVNSVSSPVNPSSPRSQFLALHGQNPALPAAGASPLGVASPTGSRPTNTDARLEKKSGMAGRLRWRRITLNVNLGQKGEPLTSTSTTTTRPPCSSASANEKNTVGNGGGGGGGATAAGGATTTVKSVSVAPVRVALSSRTSAVRAVDFASENSLCVVRESETVLIALGNSSEGCSSSSSGIGSGTGVRAPQHVAGAAAANGSMADCVVWRSVGAYRSLAVCRVNHHIALALGHSSIVVFPSRILAGDGTLHDTGIPGDNDGGFTAGTSSASFFHSNLSSSRFFSDRMHGGGSPRSSAVPTPAFSPTRQNSSTTAVRFPSIPNEVDDAAAAGPQYSNGGVRITLASRGLSATVGIYHIVDMRWHRVSSHTLLCVTCTHPLEPAAFMMLYTVQSLSTTRRYTNVMEEYPDGGWGLCRGGYEGDGVPGMGNINMSAADGTGGNSLSASSDSIVQLVPAGVIALAYTPSAPSAGLSLSAGSAALPRGGGGGGPTKRTNGPPTATPRSMTPAVSTLSVSGVGAMTTTWGRSRPPPVAEMHTGLVPNFSRSAEANSTSTRMEFVHVEGDGTVRTSSYSFGRQKHASFAKQRAVGLACTGLLKPLLQLYGTLSRVTVLPTWQMRPFELGHQSGKQPKAVEVLLSAARRYRLILRFACGVVLAVMVDLSAVFYRVECYLALGLAPLLSLRPISSIPEVSPSSTQRQGARQPPVPQTAIGTTTVLLAGLLGFPPTASSLDARSSTSNPLVPTAHHSFAVDGTERTSWATSSQAPPSSSASSSSSRSTSPGQRAGVRVASSLSPPPPRAVWGVVLLQVEPSGLQARVLTVAPLTEAKVAGVSDVREDGDGARDLEEPTHATTATGVAISADRKGSGVAAIPQPGSATPPATTAAPAAAAPRTPAAVSEKDVEGFMARKCPEKRKFLPALLKATQQDAGKLLAQLIVKYGPLEAPTNLATDAAAVHNENTTTNVACASGAAAGEVPAPPETPAVSITTATVAFAKPPAPLSVLTGGCVTTDGEVVLLVASHAFQTAGAAAAVVRICPPCLEAFAPVQRLVAVGTSQTPFIPLKAEYVIVPAVLQRRWWSLSFPVKKLREVPSSTPDTAPGDAAEVQRVQAAFCACRRVCAHVAEGESVLCEVVTASHDATMATPYVRVRSPLSPDSTDTSALTAMQYLPLPSSAAGATDVELVKGTLLVNNDVVVGVLCRRRPGTSTDGSSAASVVAAAVDAVGSRSPGTLYLYGCPAVQSLVTLTESRSAGGEKDSSDAGHDDSGETRASGKQKLISAFVLEATLEGVEAFYLSTSGEVAVLRRNATTTAAAPAVDAGAKPSTSSDAAGTKEQGRATTTTMMTTRFERWLRCFPPDTGSTTNASMTAAATTSLASVRSNGYFYVRDPTWSPPHSHRSLSTTPSANVVTAVTTIDVAGAWEANVAGLSAAAKLTSSRTATRTVLYATAESSFVHLRQLPLRSGGDSARALRTAARSSGACIGQRGTETQAGIAQYHPDAVMQLIGMARWSVLAKVLTRVLESTKAALACTTTSPPPPQHPGATVAPNTAASLSFLFSLPPEELARRLCTSAVARGFHDRPQVVQYDDTRYSVTPPRLSAAELQEDMDSTSGNNGSNNGNGAVPVMTNSSFAIGAGASGVSTASSGMSHRLYDLAATCGDLFAQLTQVLPRVTLTGLQSQEQLNLLCILQALRDTVPLSRSIDEAAARYLFFARLMSLGRRLRLPSMDVITSGATAGATAATASVPVNSVLYFEVGRTATRTVATAAYLWAAMSDSQSTLVSLLFDKASTMYLDGGTTSLGAVGGTTAAAAAIGGSIMGGGEVTWEQVEQSGVAFWLRSAADLRVMADRVARHQYQSSKDLTACALMYCTARKVSTLAALAKAQNNPRLSAFFSRNFAREERDRAAASANAYAAMSKNMPQYGAAFFLLAGDVKSAVQVLLQRCHNPFLALFVLRAAGEEAGEGPTTSSGGSATANGLSSASETLLQWYVKQRAVEVETCGALDMWELACLSWVDATPQTPHETTVQRRIQALQHIAAHPTAHPEALCALRYARDGVAALSCRRDRFLSPAREVVCLLRLGRFCVAHRLDLNGYLHYRDAEGLLSGLRAEAAAAAATAVRLTGGSGMTGSGTVAGAARRPPPPQKMAADYNTGTLIFRGFDSDSDDDAAAPPAATGKSTKSTAAFDGVAGEGPDEEETESGVLSDEAVAAVQAELQYAYLRIGVAGSASGTNATTAAAATTAASATYEDVLRRMLLCFTAASSFMTPSSVGPADAADANFTASTAAASPSLRPSQSDPFQDLLTSLLRQLLSDVLGGTAAAPPANRASASKPPPTDTSISAVPRMAESMALPLGQPVPNQSSPAGATAAASPPSFPDASIAGGGGPSFADRPIVNFSLRERAMCAAEGWYSLCIPLLHLLLGKVALQRANYLVLLSLQRIPVSTEGVLEAADRAGLLGEICSRPFDLQHPAPAAAATVSDPAETYTPPRGRTSPLYLPLVAFFSLLGRCVVQFYREACAAEEKRLGSASGGVRVTPAGGSPTAATAAGGGATDDTDGPDAMHQNMFEALMAAAAAAETSRVGSNASFPGPAGSRRATSPYGGRDGADDGDVEDMEGADDEGTPGLDLCLGSSSATLAITESAQLAFLLSCCQAQLQLRLTEHLRQLTQAELQQAARTPTTQRAVDAGILYTLPLSPSAQAMLIQRRLLLCMMLLDVTAQWASLAEETMLRLYTALPRYAPGPLTDPNGVFLEVRLVVLRMRDVLVALLAAPPGALEAAAAAAVAQPAEAKNVEPSSSLAASANSSLAPLPSTASPTSAAAAPGPTTTATTWLEENTVMLLDLCTTQLELYWTLPPQNVTQCRQLAVPTRAVLRMLSRATASHASAQRLLQGMLRPVKDNTAADVPPASSQQTSMPNSSPGAPMAVTGRGAAVTAAATNTTSGFARDAPLGDGSTDNNTLYYCPALAFLQLAWLRRHHTHSLLRSLLIAITLDMGRHQTDEYGPLTTDRLILTQHSHSVTGVRFDASSCDSVVCTTDAGTTVGHGYRELLAGDNEEALAGQSTERNLATAAFTLGLAAQQDRLRLATEHHEGQHTREIVAALAAKSVLESRPRCAVAANGMPASHPHLPFFVMRHRDGHLDLYPYASQECLASFCCTLRYGQLAGGGGPSSSSSSNHGTLSTHHASAFDLRGLSMPGMWGTWGAVGPAKPGVGGSAATGRTAPIANTVAGGVGSLLGSGSAGQRIERYAVTPVAFSPNGYIIAVGLSDGSIAGWRFGAAAVESAPVFTFPQLFASFGIRACLFCGDRSSLLVVVGLAKEPHPLPLSRATGARPSAGSSAPVLPAMLSTSFAMMSPISAATAPFTVAGSVNASPSELVGEVLVLDTMLDAGSVIARCALPFMPTYAVFLNPLRAVLLVSTDGRLATYSVPNGRLAILGNAPMNTVLSSLWSPFSATSPGASPERHGRATSSSTVNGDGVEPVYITCVAKSDYDPLVALGTSKGLVLLLHLRHIAAAMRSAERRVRNEGEDLFMYYPPAASGGAYGGVSTGNSSGSGGNKSSATKHKVGAAAASAGSAAGTAAPRSATSWAVAEPSAPATGNEYLKNVSQTSVLREATCVQAAAQVQSRSAVEDLVFSPSMLLAGLRDGKVMATAIIAQATRTKLTAECTVPMRLLEVTADAA